MWKLGLECRVGQDTAPPGADGVKGLAQGLNSVYTN